jgi:hypothetical protein
MFTGFCRGTMIVVTRVLEFHFTVLPDVSVPALGFVNGGFDVPHGKYVRPSERRITSIEAIAQRVLRVIPLFGISAHWTAPTSG